MQITGTVLLKTPVNHKNKLSSSLKHAFQNLFPSIKCNCTTTKETENIIMSFNTLQTGDANLRLLRFCITTVKDG
jgi:hypothetical protein